MVKGLKVRSPWIRVPLNPMAGRAEDGGRRGRLSDAKGAWWHQGLGEAMHRHPPPSLPGTQPRGHLARGPLRADPGGREFLLLDVPWSVRLFLLPQDPPPFGDPWKGSRGNERGGGGRIWGQDLAVGLVLAFAGNRISDQTLPLLSQSGVPPEAGGGAASACWNAPPNHPTSTLLMPGGLLAILHGPVPWPPLGVLAKLLCPQFGIPPSPPPGPSRARGGGVEPTV